MVKLIRFYTLFDKGVKKVARYQQFFAIEETLERISKLDISGKREGGLIWHTQGSGKSLTMLMLSLSIKYSIAKSKIIIVTDRKDLDKQIYKVFIKNNIEARRAKSGRDLIELIQSGRSVITTLIHKFNAVQNEKVIIDNPDIFVLVDESHRTQ